MSRYFKLVEDLKLTRRWHLGEITDSAGADLDCRDFTTGQPIWLGPPMRISSRHDDSIFEVSLPLVVEVQSPGPSLDLTLSSFDVLIATPRVAELLETICRDDVQRIPVKVGDHSDWYEVVNCVCRVDCIDESKSEIEWWRPKDRRPDIVGTPRMITRLVIDPNRTEGRHLFRLKTWEVAIIASETVKREFENNGFKGVSFRECSLR